ncbi:MAG: glycosyltransferase 87 family protein [Deltaproteobacteria bacterium]|nr:glycosyltransferase 87 family protein [Deltaproteobacteria bacterium]
MTIPVIATWPAHRGAGYGGASLLAAFFWIAAWRLHQRLTTRELSGKATRVSLLVGIVLRLSLAGTQPFTSNDVHRYIWDGHVAAAGLDPYRLTPAQAERALSLRGQDTFAPPPDNRDVPTLYPPLALALFSLCAHAGPDLALPLWKALCAAASIASLLLMAFILRKRGASQHLVLVSLSPLLILEAAVGAHVDVFVALFLTLSFAILPPGARHQARARAAAAAVALGLAILMKFTPALVALALFACLGKAGKLRAAFATCLAATLSFGYMLPVALGFMPGGSLATFFRKWRFGSPFFSTAPPPFVDGQIPWASFLLAAGALVWLSVELKRRHHDRALQVALATPLLASPVVFPWYLMPLAAVLPLAPSSYVMAWVALHPLTYEVIDSYAATGAWQPARWPLNLLLLTWALLRLRHQRTREWLLRLCNVGARRETKEVPHATASRGP